MKTKPHSRVAARLSRNGQSRISIGAIRRREIIDAAISVIAEEGIANLSLSAIEDRTGMSRGQLTYYFRTKEKILLAVFDRVLELMYEQLGRPASADGQEPVGGWEMTQYLLEALLRRPPLSPEFSALQYTFLSQISHREDFRERLAGLYEEWRGHMMRGLAGDMKLGARPAPTRAMASFVQALLHGLTMQLAAAPNAFDRGEMLELCREILGSYLYREPSAPRPSAKRRHNASRKPRREVNHGPHRP